MFIKNIPNLITLSRIILIPVYLSYFSNGNYTLAGIVFSISAFTDFLDGYLARKYDLTTKLGKILDPLADKITIISILIILIVLDIIPGILATVILLRELIILIGSVLVFYIGENALIEANKIGKLAIFLLYISLAAHILGMEYFGIIILYFVIPLNIISGIKYIINTWGKIDFKNNILKK